MIDHHEGNAMTAVGLGHLAVADQDAVQLVGLAGNASSRVVGASSSGQLVALVDHMVKAKMPEHDLSLIHI